MNNREMNLKIFGKIMNSEEKYATLDGISFGVKLSGKQYADIVNFVNEFGEVISTNADSDKCREWAEVYFEKHVFADESED